MEWPTLGRSSQACPAHAPDELKGRGSPSSHGRARHRTGGTGTGEHGMGLGKRELFRTKLDEAVTMMHTLKRALDTTELLNPGKLFA